MAAGLRLYGKKDRVPTVGPLGDAGAATLAAPSMAALHHIRVDYAVVITSQLSCY